MENTTKEIYYLNKETLPTIPVPHDCIVKDIYIKDDYITFVFEDDISYHDSISYHNPKAKSLIIKYHFAYDSDDYSLYKWVKPKDKNKEDGDYKYLERDELTKLPKSKYDLEYLYHNIGYCSIIIKLFSNGYIILDADIDYIEYEWIY